MSDQFLIDASVALAWVHPSQASREMDQLLAQIGMGAEVFVPALWFLETANGLLELERRKKLTKRERHEALRQLTSLDISADPESHRLAFSAISELAAVHNLSVYDACYLELALRRNLPLASRDDSVRQAAKKCGVKLLF